MSFFPPCISTWGRESDDEMAFFEVRPPAVQPPHTTAIVRRGIARTQMSDWRGHAGFFYRDLRSNLFWKLYIRIAWFNKTIFSTHWMVLVSSCVAHRRHGVYCARLKTLSVFYCSISLRVRGEIIFPDRRFFVIFRLHGASLGLSSLNWRRMSTREALAEWRRVLVLI